jgi:hypothetical protein
VFVDEFYRPKRTPERHPPPMLMAPQKLFSKTSQLSSLDTPKNCRHAATFPCRPCRSWAGVLQILRHDRRNTNATPFFRVSLRRGVIGQNIDATPETLKYMGVAVLRIFWGECLNTFQGNLNNFSL